MIENETQLALNVQTLRECGGAFPTENCSKALSDVMEFMQRGGRLQEQLQARSLIQIDGNSILFSPTLYPTEKSASPEKK